jgi:UDP-N-acetylglucosamine 4,6-dehydratase/5-epimerase
VFKNKTLLITGGTGSFGNAVLEGFLDSDLREIRVLSRDEKKQHDMRTAIKSQKLKFYIGDVRDMDSVSSAMQGVDLVFHAAALKQVPSCEFHPMEAVRTNVLGADNVMRAAKEANVDRVICLSTDKAVMPINAMGMSKALMEKSMVAHSRFVGAKKTVFSATRYGNVMASRGSVIPLFVQQIKAKQPLTLTDPNMTRFLMPLSEAIDLVIFAYQNAKQGDIIVQKTPACTMQMLAEAMLKVFNVNNPIKIIGTRHGEKLHETLLSREERLRADDLGAYFRVPADDRDLNYNLYFSEGVKTTDVIDYSSDNTTQLTFEEVKQKLLKLPYIQNELRNWPA